MDVLCRLHRAIFLQKRWFIAHQISYTLIRGIDVVSNQLWGFRIAAGNYLSALIRQVRTQILCYVTIFNGRTLLLKLLKRSLLIYRQLTFRKLLRRSSREQKINPCRECLLDKQRNIKHRTSITKDDYF